jgi:hypothetical protein
MHPGGFDPDAAHRTACEAGQPLYFDPRLGLWVMTADALLARGTCCGNGCRHCPFVGTAKEHPKRRGTG